MVIPVGDLIAYLSSILELLPGDVVFTGTPSGVGMSRTSPHYLSPGDQLESWIEGIGSMSHTFIGLYADQSAAEPKPLTEGGWMSTNTTPTPVLHHVTLKTNRVGEMIEWYGIAVGMTTNHHSPFGAWMTNDAANHRVALLAHPALSDDPDKIPHTGMHHLAFEYADIGQLLATYDRLKGHGIVPHAGLDHGLTTSLYYLDPDGNSVELQADNFGDWAASSEWMRTAPEFEVNPIGVPIDPDQLLASWRDGADAAELHRRGYAGEFAPSAPLDLRLPPEPAPPA